MPNKQPERSVEEWEKEFDKYVYQEGTFKAWATPEKVKELFTQTLQTERQRCEEMLEAERERIALIVRSIDFEARQTDTRVEAAIWQSIKNLKETVLQAITQPNNTECPDCDVHECCSVHLPNNNK